MTRTSPTVSGFIVVVADKTPVRVSVTLRPSLVELIAKRIDPHSGHDANKIQNIPPDHGKFLNLLLIDCDADGRIGRCEESLRVDGYFDRLRYCRYGQFEVEAKLIGLTQGHIFK